MTFHRSRRIAFDVFLSLFTILTTAFSVPTAGAQSTLHESVLTLEFWTERDHIIHPEGSPEERLLRELQYVVSGMVYGYRFTYTPSFRDRVVEERFTLEPVATIPWGDSPVSTVDVEDRGTTVYGQFLYALNDRQRLLRSRWDSAMIPDSTGRGSGDIMRGFTGKTEAIQEAVRLAVRTYLQGQTRNRPREVSGTLLLEEAPHIFVDEGRYVARVDIRLLVEAFQEYEAF